MGGHRGRATGLPHTNKHMHKQNNHAINKRTNTHALQSCNNYVLGAIYLLVFITIGAFILANLVVAVVVTNLVSQPRGFPGEE